MPVRACWTDSPARYPRLIRLTLAGMALLPNMGRRTIWLEDDDESYGRNGLLGEYIRRQTGKIRNRTQVASHIAVLRKHNPNDKKRAWRFAALRHFKY
jgi:hypothetical protein